MFNEPKKFIEEKKSTWNIKIKIHQKIHLAKLQNLLFIWKLKTHKKFANFQFPVSQAKKKLFLSIESFTFPTEHISPLCEFVILLISEQDVIVEGEK